MRNDDETHTLCLRHGCSDKRAKIHAAQFNRGWHPHPPVEFEQWWRVQMEAEQGVDSVRAYNCQIYRQRFLEAKGAGVV